MRKVESVKTNRFLISASGVLLFLSGIMLGLLLSSGILWGSLEAYANEAVSDGRRLSLDCPLMLAPGDSGEVGAEIANSTGEEVSPVIAAAISGKPPVDQTLSLSPGEVQPLSWRVDTMSRVYNWLILVNVEQRRYRDLEPRQGSCGILVYSLFGLTGTGTFGLIVGVSLALMLLGGFTWIRARGNVQTRNLNFEYASGFLGALVLASLLSSLQHWWGLILVFNALILLMLGIIFTEFILRSGNKN